MSLLDRVQRQGGDGGVPHVMIAPPAPAAPSEGDDPQVVPRPQPGGHATSMMDRPGLMRQTAAATDRIAQAHLLLRTRVQTKLVEELSTDDSQSDEFVRKRIIELVGEVSHQLSITITRQDRVKVAETITEDVLGLGPLESLLKNPEISEIMINGPDNVYIEQKGKLTLSPVHFDSAQQLMQVIDRIVRSIGRRIDESSPMVDARLKDGSRVNVIIPPLSLTGATVTIRKFAKEALRPRDLLTFKSITEDMLTFIEACVRGRLNILVSGGTGSGKTTTLNILSGFIPEYERIVTIEDAAELQLHQEHVVPLETRPANVEGRGAVHIRELVMNALRMRPDRIVIGECRGGEALDMLQSMNTGNDGSLTTLHANSPRESIGRLETLVLMAGADLPSRAIREQISSAIHIIVQQSRLRDGTRKITSIAEVTGIVDGEIHVQELFTFSQQGIDDDGKVIGWHEPTGIVTRFLDHLAVRGEVIDPRIFEVRPRPNLVAPESASAG